MKLRSLLTENTVKIPKIWYHGTSVDFDEFDLKFITKNFYLSSLGIYLTAYKFPPPNGINAEGYAEASLNSADEIPLILTCQVNTDNFFIADSSGYSSSISFLDKNVNKLKDKRTEFDGICAFNHSKQGFVDMSFALVIFNPKNIKIIKKEVAKNVRNIWKY